MKILGFEISRAKKPDPAPVEVVEAVEVVEEAPQSVMPAYDGPPPPTIRPRAYVSWGNDGPFGYTGTPFMVVGFDGEKNLGEMGPIKRYVPEYDALRWRSRQLYLESDVCFSAINKRVEWVIGSGLKLQAQPKEDVLRMNGIKLNAEEFNTRIEGWFNTYAASKMADYSGVQTLNQLCEEACRESWVAGRILVILRVIKGVVKVQHIDGGLVSNPFGLNMQENRETNGYDYYTASGNRVRHGVEIDETGRHIAYYVRIGAGYKHKRVQAVGSNSGLVMAFMYYGNKHGINSTDGMPILSVVMETAKKLERASNAALGGFEERQKVPMFFEHGKDSKQIDPQEGRRVKANAGFADAYADIPVTTDGQVVADKLAVSMGKDVYNLPNDVTIKAIDSKQELAVVEFINHHSDVICAAINMPPDVVSGKYNGSFSSSRMSAKATEKTVMDDRVDFAGGYLLPIYTLQMYVLVLNNYLNAPGFVEAVRTGNDIVIAAYLSSRWVGDKFPDIDPLKTANYLRTMLGEGLAHAPLMTMEAAAEEANQGDYKTIIEQIKREKEMVDKSGIEAPEKKPGKPEDEGSGS